jgi:DNA-binding NtrC family response regulator
LRFSPSDGHIWLDNRRMVLMHTLALGTLRREIVDTLGLERARALLTRVGYESGALDAELAAKVRSGNKLFDVFDAFSVGPQLHALEGVVKVEPIKFDVDVENRKFFAEYLWINSFEDEGHIRHYGIGADSACWMQIGYACGYSTVFMGRPIIFREVECRAMGALHCRIIGKPEEEWDDPEEDLKYLRAENFTSQPEQIITQAIASPLPSAPQQEDDKWDMVGASAGFNVAYHMLRRVAKTEASVIFLGESGVGKEMFARRLHRISNRADRIFLAVNCAAIPENLIESELFGVERGAYTGATESRPGRFERAQDGTLFLDEIGSLTLSAQGKLLRALQEGEIERVGDSKVRKVDVRVIAATNIDLKQAVEDGLFREDLFYRLNVFPIHIPPLRERKSDIPLLLDRFLKRFTRRHSKGVTGFSTRAITGLMNYQWPGNIRELENMIERGVILAEEDGAIDLCHLFTSGESLDLAVFGLNKSGNLDRSLGQDEAVDVAAVTGLDQIAGNMIDQGIPLDELETKILLTAVERAGGNLSAAARLLNITRPQLAYRLQKIQGGTGPL